ncbi:putative telomere-associated protein Rif1 [Tanacetum coccineum]
MQAVMKLATQVNEKMRETANVWAPPIYRRLVSADKREKDMSERCLLKVKSTICPPPMALSKALVVDVKKKLLPALEELLKQGKKIQAMQAWGWFTRLIGSYAIKNRHLINQLLKIPEQTFPDSDPQVKIATQIAWEALIDALIILPTQESATKAANEDFFEANGLTKSIKLIMTPLIGIMSSKCDTSVHLSCLNTWKYLLHKFDTFVNHPSVIKTILNPILKVVFQAGPDNKSIWSWNICLDLLDNYAFARKPDVNTESNYPIKWMLWNLSQFGFFVKMVDVFMSHGEVGCDAALKIFRSSLKRVHFNLTSSDVPFSEILSCFNAVITCLKKISESGISLRLDFIEIVTEELQPSILGSPLYKMELDTKYTENLNELTEIMTISPIVCLIVLYFHTMIDSALDEQKLSSYVTSLLASYDSFEILNTLTCLLYKFLVSDCLNYWAVIANCLKDHKDGNSELDDTRNLVISRFLAYPFVIFSSGSQSKLDFVQISEPWESLYVSSQCFENMFPVFDRFLEDYLKADLLEKTQGFEYLFLCGDAITYVLENSLKSSDTCRNNNNVGDQTRHRCTKTSLQCAARFLSVSHAEAKVNLQILDTISRVFSSLVRVVESFHSEEDIIPFIEVISTPLLQWLLDRELHHEDTISELRKLWITTLKCLQNSWPPINFNATLLNLQAAQLEATLDHPNSSVADPTIAFWNSTYGEQTKLDYPQNLLPVLDKLSRNGKINLCGKRYSRIDASISPPQKHKITTTLNRCVKRVELVNGLGSNGSKRKKLELTERQKEVRRAQQGRSNDCEGRGPGVRTYTSVDFSQGTEDESQEESQDVRNVEFILEMLKKK